METLLTRSELKQRLKAMPPYKWATGRSWVIVRDALPYVTLPGGTRPHHRMSEVLVYLGAIMAQAPIVPQVDAPTSKPEVPLHRRRPRLKATG